ncbi:hypothetical protein AYO21_05247 [Fonsecaea monophora]|uniref:Uncharacterized protein n=1 Tax=Fonsecaea monophora TaxID=254056 RepID=A0A177F9P9_9EURO|nr:hypothetical protein AYO21_05247 [Fonsecaea monophora]OAG40546.1 hypothetical protein AYO21_05247 [Fonsecaea monophora]
MPLIKPSAILLPLVCAASSILGVCSANPIVGRPGTEPASYTLETVHQFPNFTWLEIFEIVPTDISNGVIYLVDPEENPAPASAIAQFPPGTCLTGIAELRPDVFYVQSVDGFVYNFTFTPGSATLWEVDQRDQARGAVVTKVLNMPENKIPNGLGVLPAGRKGRGESTLLLSADSGGGVVYLIDVSEPTRALSHVTAKEIELLVVRNAFGDTV